MTKTTKALAGIGATAVAVGLLILATSTYTPPPGWWGGSDTTLAPCPATPPGPHPYLLYTNPKDGHRYYLRADGAVRRATDQVDGHFAGEGLATHTLLYILRDLLFPSENGMEIPIRTGVDNDHNSIPDYIFTAPWRNATIEGHPDQTLCDKWRQGNELPPTSACPSNLSMLLYSQAIDNFPDWTSTNAARNAEITRQCVPLPPATPTIPFITATIPPQCPTCAAVATCQPTSTRTKTATPTKTITPCVGCSPTPTASSGIDPSKP